MNYFENFALELDQIENKSSLVSSAMAGAPGGQIVREWNDQQSFLKNIYHHGLQKHKLNHFGKHITDSEFFRSDTT
jgi:hypothetical protein